MAKFVKLFMSQHTDSKLISELHHKLTNAIDEFKLNQEGNITSIGVGIFLNCNLTLEKHKPTIEHNNVKLYILPFNDSSTISKKIKETQDISQMALRGKLDFILQKTLIQNDPNIKSLIIVLGYNKDESDFKKIIINTAQNERDTVPFRVLTPKFKLDSIVLSDKLTSEVQEILILLENFDLIFKEWGFNEIDKNMRTILNFFGSSGTGKTMTAHGIAMKLGKKIMALNYSEIESKYVGDAPKNLVRAFEEAKSNEAVLFFDEADSFLGKRISNVSHSSDQAINSLRSQMLILLDDFEGVVIFATNMIENYDKAFNSRIMSHLHFELPDLEMRKKIILKTLPPRIPYENNIGFSDIEISQLGEVSEGFSGREIKNSILNALTITLKNNRKIVKFHDFEIAFQNQKNTLEKINKAVPKVTFSPELKKNLEEKIKDTLNKEKDEQEN